MGDSRTPSSQSGDRSHLNGHRATLVLHAFPPPPTSMLLNLGKPPGTREQLFTNSVIGVISVDSEIIFFSKSLLEKLLRPFKLVNGEFQAEDGALAFSSPCPSPRLSPIYSRARVMR